MEHNAPSLLSLPQEIKELIFNLGLSVVDLLKLRSVCKALLTSLSNQKLWRATCIREFDLEFIDENSNWIELASKYGAINYNIRKARVLVQALAVNTTNNNRLYTGESFVFDDNKIVVNWLRTDGHGSSSLDYSDHSAIVDITTRKEAHQIRLKKDRSLIVIGDKLAQLDWNSYNVKPYFTNVKLSDSGQSDTFDNAIPTNRNTRTILSNSDPDQKYIVVIVDGTLNTLGTHTDIVMRTYDLYEESVVKSFAIKNFAKSGYSYSNPNVILHGDFIYAWQEETNTLHVFNLTSGRDEGDQHQVSFGKETGFLLGAHKSVVFGAINSSTDTASGMWFYDLGTKKTRTLRDSMFRTIKSMIVHCGVLVVECGQYMYFVDYLSDPNQLKLISTLQLDQVYRTSLQPMKDGKLFLSGYNSGAKLIDFEHANDNCEVLFVTKSAKSKDETKYTQISLKAYELVSRAKELLGTHEYVSRYFKMNAEQRFGIIYAKNQVKKNNALTFSIVAQKNPEYNTPYMYHRMTLGADEEKPRIVWVIPPAIKEFFGEVILFYEEFDGTQWKLSKPRHWAEYIK